MNDKNLILATILSLNISATVLAVSQPSVTKDVLGVFTATITGLYGYLVQSDNKQS